MGGAEMATPREVFPFVVGCQRSGTTLLQAMLDRHPELAMAPESHFIVPLARRFGDSWDAGGGTDEAFAEALLDRRRFAYWRIDRPALLSALAAARPRDFAGAVRTLYSLWARRQGKPRYGDKTPRYSNHLPELGALLPEARFIHLIRDGRDVALSMAAAFERGPQSAVEGAMFWRAAVEAGRRGGAGLGPDRYLEVHYERLVAEPEPALGEICAFLRLEQSPAMLDPAAAAERVVAGYPPAADHSNLALPLAFRRDWRAEMPRGDILDFELLAGDLLAELGYETGPEPSRGEALAARRTELLAAELIALRRRLFTAERRLAEARAANSEEARS